jgi:hypothetical protein
VRRQQAASRPETRRPKPLAIRGASARSSRCDSTGRPSGLINCTYAPRLPPRGSMYAMTSSRDQDGALADLGVGNRVVPAIGDVHDHSARPAPMGSGIHETTAVGRPTDRYRRRRRARSARCAAFGAHQPNAAPPSAV